MTQDELLSLMRYFYTRTGIVYPAYKFNVFDYGDKLLLMQSSKRDLFQQLSAQGLIPKEAHRIGWMLSKKSIVRVVNHDELPPEIFKDNGNAIVGNVDRRNTFIIGAGASANCVFGPKKTDFDLDILKPPLGNELFLERFKFSYEKYEGVKEVLCELQLPNVDVESYMEDEWGEIETNCNDRMMHRHINILFYLQELLKDISCHVQSNYYDFNLYSRFGLALQKILNNRPQTHFSFISFNQDTILENFLCRYIGEPFKTIDDYIELNRRTFSVYKPHGSWNWGWQYPNAKRHSPALFFDKKLSFYDIYFQVLGDHLSMVDWHSFGTEAMIDGIGKITIDKGKIKLFQASDMDSYFPSILLPYRDKDEFSMPPRHLHSLIGQLGRTENLFVIGWKGNESAFNKMLVQQAHNLKRIVIINPDKQTVMDNLVNIVGKSTVELVFYTSFEEFIDNIQIELSE